VSAAAPVRLSRLRRKIGSRLRESVATKPAVTLHTTAPAGALRSEGGPGVTSLVAAATVRALGLHPALNGWIADDELTTFAEVHLGIAVDTEAGLVVPVVRDAHLLDAAGLREEIAALAERARAGQLTPDDVLDGTFTLTTLGAFGVEQFTPIVNPPQMAVLGIGAIRTMPAVRDGQLVAEPYNHLSLTFDHAAVDGAPAARFLAAVVDRLTVQSPKESA
jgi:pyruvate dehydrogenase E2 component (dihydrolipoamide acetyltransferase)